MNSLDEKNVRTDCLTWLRDHADEFDDDRSIEDTVLHYDEEWACTDYSTNYLLRLLINEIDVYDVHPIVTGITLPTTDDYTDLIDPFERDLYSVMWTKTPCPRIKEPGMLGMYVKSPSAGFSTVGPRNASVGYQVILLLKENSANVGELFPFGEKNVFRVISPNKAVSLWEVGSGPFNLLPISDPKAFEYDGSEAQQRLEAWLEKAKQMEETYK